MSLSLHYLHGVVVSSLNLIILHQVIYLNNYSIFSDCTHFRGMEHHQTKYETMDQEKSQTMGNIKLS